MPERRRFPPPWTAEEQKESFVVKDSTGQAPAYPYFDDDRYRRSVTNRLMRDEAQRIAANIAKLPGPLETAAEMSVVQAGKDSIICLCQIELLK